ncbi:hypothetical protein HY090_02330 [Candidatus Kaiserbacteria bacterium]|nr:hypothetical protein [Candidatus Kaiserbacteria bacterium]
MFARFFFPAAIVLAIALIAGYFLEHKAQSPAQDLSNSTASSSYAYTNASEDMIFVTTPKPNQSTTGTIVIKGFARGTWFFEASFPIEVRNDRGLTIGEGQGRADTDWMTKNFVPFTAEVNLSLYNGPATIVLKKDNPSGDPARDASLSFPVVIE